MKRFWGHVAKHRLRIIGFGLSFASVVFLLWYRLGSLVPGLSLAEKNVITTPVGLEALYNSPWYLPLNIVRSVVFWGVNDLGAFVGRVPNTLFGLLAVMGFCYVIWRWHGKRTAVMAGALFATSAWVLHVSRLASFDVLYLCAIPLLLFTGILLQRYADKAIVLYGSLLTWFLLLYVPGLVWLVVLTVFWQRDILVESWKELGSLWKRLGCVLLVAILLPLLLRNLLRPGELLPWIGLPDQWASLLTAAKQFGMVWVHLFVHGPKNPQIWLDTLPILDIFTLVACVLGIYFYARHIQAFRSRLLFSYALVGWILVGLSGPVSLSLLVPLLYIFAATGIAYLLREWLKIFPVNPFARTTGIALISLAVALSCLYNVRSYFIAWPHNQATKNTFRHRL